MVAQQRRTFVATPATSPPSPGAGPETPLSSTSLLLFFHHGGGLLLSAPLQAASRARRHVANAMKKVSNPGIMRLSICPPLVFPLSGAVHVTAVATITHPLHSPLVEVTHPVSITLFLTVCFVTTFRPNDQSNCKPSFVATAGSQHTHTRPVPVPCSPY